MRDAEGVSFLQWALPQLGMRWPGFRKVRKQVHKRLGRRLAELGLADLAAYRAHLEQDPDEWHELDGLCRITISRFYRDRGVFDFIAEHLLPTLAQSARTAGRPELRCWSAGCAGGEEPYGLRLIWQAKWQERFPEVRLAVLASDPDPNQLRRAREAIYPLGNTKDLPEELRVLAFNHLGQTVHLRSAFVEGVTFVQQDIRAAMPDGPFDLLLCRNLAFTYFDDQTQRRIGAELIARLGPGGALVIGKGERLPEPFGLDEVMPHLGIFSCPAATRALRVAQSPC